MVTDVPGVQEAAARLVAGPPGVGCIAFILVGQQGAGTVSPHQPPPRRSVRRLGKLPLWRRRVRTEVSGRQHAFLGVGGLQVGDRAVQAVEEVQFVAGQGDLGATFGAHVHISIMTEVRQELSARRHRHVGGGRDTHRNRLSRPTRLAEVPVSELSFIWAELSGRCQLSCVHCYAESGPSGDHGSMTAADWRRVIDEAAGLGAGMVQFIGGEPTLHPDLPDLVDHALAAGVEVEVFSNLVHVTANLWEVFARPGVSLACSYYSDDPAQHAAVTGTQGSYARTKANIATAVARSIPLRAGVIDLSDGQRVGAAVAELEGLGVQDIGTDRLRQVGRGIRDTQASIAQLCGNCADGVAAVSPTGEVWPCVFSRWLPIGNARQASLSSILDGADAARVRGELVEAFATRGGDTACRPNCSPTCEPSRCAPTCGPSWPTCAPSCGPSCNPCAPRKRCWPSYGGCKPQGGKK